MKISNSHQRFAYRLNDQTALEYPERFLGPNWKNVLNFWIYLDTLSIEDFRLIGEQYCALDYYIRLDAQISVDRAIENTIGLKYVDAAWVIRGPFADSYVTLELICSHNLETLTFLPLFLNF